MKERRKIKYPVRPGDLLMDTLDYETCDVGIPVLVVSITKVELHPSIARECQRMTLLTAYGLFDDEIVFNNDIDYITFTRAE